MRRQAGEISLVHCLTSTLHDALFPLGGKAYRLKKTKNKHDALHELCITIQ